MSALETTTETEEYPNGRAHRWLAEVGAPDWIKAEMSGLRRETAGHRQRRNAAEAETERLTGELATAQRQTEELRTALRSAEPEIMRAAQKGVVHKNTASRKVSRLAHRIGALAS